MEISQNFVAFSEYMNFKAGKAAALPKFSDMFTLTQLGGGADYAQPLALPHLKFFMITPLNWWTVENAQCC